MVRIICVLLLLASCREECTPPVGDLPLEGKFIDPYEFVLERCVDGGLRDLPGRWFVVDPQQYFRYEYPQYEGTCETGFRRSFADPDDHDLVEDGYTFYTWSDGTRYFQRAELRFGNTTYVRAYSACITEDGTIAAVYAAFDTDRPDRIALATGTRFARMDSLSMGLTLVGELATDSLGNPMEALNLVIDGAYAYVAGWAGVDIVDITNPAVPTPVGHYDGSFNDIKVVNNGTNVVAFISPRDSEEPTSVVEVTNPQAPTFVQYLAEYSHSVFLEQAGATTRLYLATYNESVPRYDVTAPLTPVRQGMAIVPGEVSGVHDLFVANDRIYANNTQQGLVVFDVSADLATATERGRDIKGYSHASWAGTAGGRSIILHGDEGMTRTPDGGAHLRILDGDTMEFLAKYQTRPEVGIHNFELHGDRAYVAYYQDGVRIVDLSDPTQPREVAHYNTWEPETAYGGAFEGALGIRLVNGLIYVADDLRGLLIFREE